MAEGIEKPDIEGQETPTSTPPEEKQVDIDGLIQQLESANITDPKQLEGKLRNAAGYSEVQAQRDAIAQELAAMRQEMQSIKQEPKTDDYSNYDMDSGEPIDLIKAIDSALDRREKKAAERQMQAQQRLVQMQQKITGHPRYKFVKEEFEAALSDPMTSFKIQSGQVNPESMFHEMMTEKALKLANETVKAWKERSGSEGVKPPHVESQAQVSSDKVHVPSDKEKKLEQLQKKGASGAKPLHDDEMDYVLDTVLGDIFKEPSGG